MEKFEQNNPNTNLHKLSTERKELRQIANETGMSDSVSDFVKEELEERNKKASNFKIKETGGLREAINKIKRDKELAESYIDHSSISEQLGANYDRIHDLRDRHNDLRDFEMRRMLRLKKRLVKNLVKWRLLWYVIDQDLCPMVQNWLNRKNRQFLLWKH